MSLMLGWEVPLDAVIRALSYVGSRELASLVETSRSAISRDDVQLACVRMGGEAYESLVSKASSCPPSVFWSLEALSSVELTRISDGLSRAQQDDGRGSPRGYLVSKSWAWHARRYCEASRTKLQKKETPKKSRGRSRTASTESLPPWPDANADLLCEHGALAPRSVPRAKRILVDRTCWRAIALRFPLTTKFKGSTAAVCRACLEIVEERARQKAEERTRLDDEKKKRRSEIDETAEEDVAIRRLLSRERAKRGFPTHRLRTDPPFSLEGVPPLSPGRYRLVPRRWMQAWRGSLRTASSPRPGPPTTSDCLCVAHGLPLVAPDVADFVVGNVPFLSFDSCSSTLSEILDADEWRALNSLFPVDFAVAFDVGPDRTGCFLRVTWVTEPCKLCDATGTAVNLKFRPRDARRLGRSRYDDDSYAI